MTDQNKTKHELIAELDETRNRLREIESAQNQCQQDLRGSETRLGSLIDQSPFSI